MIRRVRETDFEQILNLSREVVKREFKEGTFGWREEDARETIKQNIKGLYGLIEEQNGKVTGFIGGNIYNELFDHRNKVFCEVCWYSVTNGLRLFNELLKRLKAEGVGKILFPSPANNNRLATFYKRKGFKELETQWIRKL